MGGEDGSHVQLAHRRHDVGVLESALGEGDLDEPGDARERSLVQFAALTTAVRLLGDVGEVEVRREGAHQLARGGEVESFEQLH